MKKIIFVVVFFIGCLLALPFLFASLGGIFKTVPLATPEIIELYMKATAKASDGKVNVDWRNVLAIDTVRFQQDFSKASESSIVELANRFIKEDIKVIKYNFQPYVNATSKLNSEKNVDVDWRKVVVVDSVLSHQTFSDDVNRMYEIAEKFVSTSQVPEEYEEWETVQEEEQYQEWEPYISFMPWLGGHYVTKTRIVEVKKLVKKVRYNDVVAVLSIDDVLKSYGHSSSEIPSTFKNYNSITVNLEKEKQTTYSLKDLNTVLNELNFNPEQIADVQNYMSIGLGMDNGNSSGGSVNSVTAQAFINKVSADAESSYTTYKVLPSITIAQAILESSYGTSGLSLQANNLFGIKAFNWSGPSVEMQTTEYVGSTPIDVTARFRAYSSWKDSIYDHAKFLTDNSRYKNAGLFDSINYIGQAYALKNAGYATDPQYPMLLINIIMQYNLDKYDADVLKNVASK